MAKDELISFARNMARLSGRRGCTGLVPVVRMILPMIPRMILPMILPCCGGQKLDVGESTEPPPPDPTVIVSDQKSPVAIAADEENLYWVALTDAPAVSSGRAPIPCTATEVQSCAKADCANTRRTIARAVCWARPSTFVLFDGSVILAGAGAFSSSTAADAKWTCAASDQEDCGDCTPLATSVDGDCVDRAQEKLVQVASMDGITVDEARIYWADRAEAAIYSCPLTGCPQAAEVSALGFDVRAIASDASTLYWATGSGRYDASGEEDWGGAIMAVPKDGSLPPYMLATGQTSPQSLVLEREYLYWTEATSSGRVLRCPKAGCPETGPEVLARDEERPYQLVVADDSVYWMNRMRGETLWNVNGTTISVQRVEIRRCALRDCGSTTGTVLTDAWTGPNALSGTSARQMTVDSEFLYWVGGSNRLVDRAGMKLVDGAVHRLAR